MQLNLLDTFSQDKFYLTQEYGTNKYIDYRRSRLRFHNGVDFGHSNKKQIIRCVHSGQCLTTYDAGGYGRYVIVLNYSDGYATWYCHLGNTFVVSGQEVSAGDAVGRMGNTGFSTASHLHFSLVFIDENGYRKYRTKENNMGYVDPQHPLDKSPSIKLPGVPDYQINWKDTMSDDYYKDLEKLLKHIGSDNVDSAMAKWDEEQGHLNSEREKNGDLLAKIDLLNGEIDSMGEDIKELEEQLNQEPEYDYGEATDPHWIKLYEILERKL